MAVLLFRIRGGVGTGAERVVAAGIVIITTPMLEPAADKTEVALTQFQCHGDVVVGRQRVATELEGGVRSKLALNREMLAATAPTFFEAFDLTEFVGVASDVDKSQSGSDGE